MSTASDNTPVLPSARRKILLVDDEEIVREIGLRILESVGFETEEAESGKAAVEILKNRGAEFACVLLDLSMPGMSGEATLQALRCICPDIPVLITSGYDKQEVASRFKGQCISGYIEKPFRPERVAELVRGVTSS